VEQFCQGSVSAEEKQRLEKYVTSIISRFAKDRRVLMWDIYNEPGQSGNGNRSFNLLRLTWDWAQNVRPSQPLVPSISSLPRMTSSSDNLPSFPPFFLQ
jgi:GH35 family endo-1,4-beta-xylanase